MALPTSFKLRVQDLAGIAYTDNDATTADDSALQQFLVDGCYDIVFRIGAVNTDALTRFTTKTRVTAWTNGTGADEYREILQVFRNNIRCKGGKVRYHDAYGDTASIHYAHAESPVWYILDGSLYVMPEATGVIPVDIYHLPDDYTIDVDTKVITDFPKAYHEHICLYAAIRVLDYRVQETVEEDEDSEMIAMIRAQQQKLQADYQAKFMIQGGGK